MVKKILMLVMVFAFFGFALMGCSLSDSPEKAAKSYLEAFFDMDKEKADTVLAGEQNSQHLPEDKITKKMVKMILSHTTVVDISEENKNDEKENTSANVNVAILGPDVQRLYEISMDEALGRYFTEGGIDDAGLNKAVMEKMEDQLNNENLKLIKQNINIEVVKVDGKWLLPEESKLKINDICVGNIGTMKLVKE